MKLFVILFEQRSGSSHLVSLLNSHREIKARGEVFDADSLRRRAAISAGAKSDFGVGYRRRITLGGDSIVEPDAESCVSLVDEWMECPDYIRGFKFKFPKQLSLFPEVDCRLRELGSQLRVIVLRRDNLIRRALSRFNHQQMLGMTGKSNFRNGGGTLPAADLDLDEFVNFVKRLERSKEEFDEWVNAFPHAFTLDYEDLISGPEILEELQQYLGVEQIRPLKSRVIKATSRRLEDAITNYSRFHRRMVAQGWQSYLDDDQLRAA